VWPGSDGSVYSLIAPRSGSQGRPAGWARAASPPAHTGAAVAAAGAARGAQTGDRSDARRRTDLRSSAQGITARQVPRCTWARLPPRLGRNPQRRPCGCAGDQLTQPSSKREQERFAHLHVVSCTEGLVRAQGAHGSVAGRTRAARGIVLVQPGWRCSRRCDTADRDSGRETGGGKLRSRPPTRFDTRKATWRVKRAQMGARAPGVGSIGPDFAGMRHWPLRAATRCCD